MDIFVPDFFVNFFILDLATVTFTSCVCGIGAILGCIVAVADGILVAAETVGFVVCAGIVGFVDGFVVAAEAVGFVDGVVVRTGEVGFADGIVVV